MMGQQGMRTLYFPLFHTLSWHFILSHTQTHTESTGAWQTLIEPEFQGIAQTFSRKPRLDWSVRGLFTLHWPHQRAAVCLVECVSMSCECVRRYQQREIERRSRRKEEAGRKAEGHFIGPLTLGNTAAKSGIRRGKNKTRERRADQEKRSQALWCSFLCVSYRSVLSCFRNPLPADPDIFHFKGGLCFSFEIVWHLLFRSHNWIKPYFIWTYGPVFDSYLKPKTIMPIHMCKNRL